MYDAETARAEVRQADRQRRAAMVAGDTAALERLIAPEAICIHLNGLRENGREYVDLASQRKYRLAELDDPEIRVIGPVAVVSGTQTLGADVPGRGPVQGQMQGVWIWERRQQGWMMIHYQGTPLPPA